MLFLRNILKVVFLLLGNLAGFKRLPGGLYYSDIRFLERMVNLSRNSGRNVVFIKSGLYLFNGDDVAIYSHTEGFSMKADVISVRWKMVSELSDEEQQAIGEADIPDKYVTLFECNNLRGRLFKDVIATLENRDNLYVFSTE